jgi:hypothetical protein
MSQVVGVEELVRGIGWVITAIDQEIDGTGKKCPYKCMYGCIKGVYGLVLNKMA